VQNISFIDPYVHPVTAIPIGPPGWLSWDVLPCKASCWFDLNDLGVTLNLLLPIAVIAYDPSAPSDAVYLNSSFGPDQGTIVIRENNSDYNSFNRPMNREWHEMFHELMDDTVRLPSPPAGIHTMEVMPIIHRRFMDEGWAVFWSCALARSLGVVDWYYYWGTMSLEFNWQVWITRWMLVKRVCCCQSIGRPHWSDKPHRHGLHPYVDRGIMVDHSYKPCANMFDVYNTLITAVLVKTMSRLESLNWTICSSPMGSLPMREILGINNMTMGN